MTTRRRTVPPETPLPVRVYAALLEEYGPQGWWPVGGRYFPSPEVSRKGRFEIVLGAILAQNTAWRNADRALENLRNAGLVDPGGILGTPAPELARLVRPSGYFNQKAARLRAASAFFLPFLERGAAPSREALLAVEGIGPETADSILLYAYGEPVFVVDAYTVRLARRLGLAGDKSSYREVQALFTESLGARGGAGGASRARGDPSLFNEYHALVVRHGKERCAKVPRCPGCVLKRRGLCAFTG